MLGLKQSELETLRENLAFKTKQSDEFAVRCEYLSFWAYQGKTNIFIYESAEFNTNNQIEGGLRVGYAKLDGTFEVAAFVRNILDADNVKGGIDFNNNTAFVNDPRVFGISARVSY